MDEGVKEQRRKQDGWMEKMNKWKKKMNEDGWMDGEKKK